MTRRQRHTAPIRQTRTRTRQRGAALASDPVENTQLLSEQLKALGLYAAPTLGDGNCLFRALSDQLYGSPSQHLKLRQEICDWMETHKQRYAPFVDDERGLDVHLKCMRQPGTYGGHLELTACAHLKRRDIKVIQPGLVYVIEWTSGANLSPTTTHSPLIASSSTSHDSQTNNRDVRRTRRERKKAEKERQQMSNDDSEEDDDDSSQRGAIYVAYHDWEHFSSVRNLSGPHSGPPHVVERPAPSRVQKSETVTKSKARQQTQSLPSSESEEEEEEVENDISSPTHVPLPMSRSCSPALSSETSTSTSLTSTSLTSTSLSFLPLPGYNTSSPEGSQLEIINPPLRFNRSPKRSIEETSAGSSQDQADYTQGVPKRSRNFTRRHFVADGDPEADTPSLLASGSSDSSSSPASSPAPTPPPSMVVIPPTPVLPSRPLTRRQRKALGLPKQRETSSRSLSRKGTAAAGKIVVPGGKYKKTPSHTGNTGTSSEKEGENENIEWVKNGSGRMDVRGFKELKI